jgi:hypothetical protein
MDEKHIFFTLFAIFFYYRYNEFQKLLNLGCYFGYNFLEKMLNFLNNDVFVGFDEIISVDTIVEKEEKPVIKYEDKFLADIRKMEKEYIFDDKELELLEEKKVSFYKQIIEKREYKLKEITKMLYNIELEYNELEIEEECLIFDDELTKEEKQSNLLDDKKRVLIELKEMEGSINYEKDIEEASIQARNFIINKRIEKLENCFIMESTPQGNVLMIYDNKRNSFKFYSDSNIPYRYLEVVSRKYVKMFDCRPLYVDMEEELNLAEKRWEKERKEKEEKEEQEKRQKEEQNTKPVEKKNVFAKFKSYNKEGGSGRVNIGVPPKNSIPMTKEQENEKIILKEKANRYTYEGKMANFNFLKKVQRKVVDKKYGLSFADFKKMQNSTK